MADQEITSIVVNFSAATSMSEDEATELARRIEQAVGYRTVEPNYTTTTMTLTVT